MLYLRFLRVGSLVILAEEFLKCASYIICQVVKFVFCVFPGIISSISYFRRKEKKEKEEKGSGLHITHSTFFLSV